MKILCNGCSFTYGSGFTETERESKIWPTILANNLGSQVSVNNIAYPGSCNLEIFLRTLNTINTEHYDTIIVQWSALRRHWFEPGIDKRYLCAGNELDFQEDFIHKNIYLTKAQRKKFYEVLVMLTGDFKCILDLATFCQTLMNLKKSNQKLIFVNGLLPLKKDLAEPLPPQVDLASHLTPFTQSLLEFDDFDDADIIKNFNKLHDSLAPTLDHWLNFSNSWQANIIDTATEGHHPGIRSHTWLANKLFDFIKIDH